MTTTSTDAAMIHVRRIGTQRILVPIIGTTPLIMHKFSEKAKRQMLDAMQGKKNVKTIRDPEADYRQSMYRTANGYGFPAIAFKNCTVSAARFYDKSVTMTELRQCLFFHGILSPEHDPQPLVPIDGDPHMREDVVTVGRGSTDLRYRGEFLEWSAVLDVTYVKSALTADSVVSLIEAGGMGVGVGEWRPEKKGDNGTFGIDGDREIQEINV